MQKILFTTLICVLAFFTVQAQTVFHQVDWPAALKQAQQENKLILIDLYFEGCMPCAEMDKRVFPDPAVAEVLNKHFISFKTDVFKEEIGKQFSMKYAASGYPTYIFLRNDGHVLDIISGFTGVSRLVPLLQKAIEDAQDYNVKGYHTDFDVAYPDFYRAAYMERKRRVPVETVTAYLDSQENLMQEAPFVVMTTFSLSPKYADFYIDHAVELADRYGRMQVRNKLLNLVSTKAKALGEKGDKKAFEQMIRTIKPVFLKEEWPRFSGSFYTAYYDGGQDAAWYLKKLNKEAAFADWWDRSNALAPVILAVKDQPSLLKTLAKWYHKVENKKTSVADLYKTGLIYLYLNDFEQAAAYAGRAQKAAGDLRFSTLKPEHIQALQAAAQSQTTDIDAVKAVVPKPFTMD